MENNSEVVFNNYGFYQLADIPTQEALNDYYEKKYYQQDNALYLHEYSREELQYIHNKIEQKAIIIDELMQKKGSSPTLLDVGCGEGFTLSWFHRRGWEVAGIDFSEYGCRQHNPEMLPWFHAGDIYGKLKEIVEQQRVYDCIWLDNVLEHVLDPEALLKMLLQISHTGTVLVIEVPNDFSVLQTKLLHEGKIDRPFWVVKPDHISYFNLDGLQNLAAACGWEKKQAIADFPIDFNLANPSANYVMDKQTGKGAHVQRLFVDTLMHGISPAQTNRYYEALAQLGLGRQISMFLKIN
jgi:2-polyprenyl-3-methyl-5-hydroxy-6-metoxy-1,4-benzoquinol methylase